MYLLVVFLPLVLFFLLRDCLVTLIRFIFNQFFIIFLGVLHIFLAFFIFYEIILNNSSTYIYVFSWIKVGSLNVNWSFYFDNLTAIMCLMIIIVSFGVQVFSLNYMGSDFQKKRFMSLLSIFTFFMLFLVTSDNFLQLILGWEGVGLCSYLLINFWYMRKNTNDSSLKALFFNRIGDLALLLAMFLYFYYLKSLDFLIIFDNFLILQSINYSFLGFEFNLLDFTSSLLVLAAVAKSAQVFLNGWLMDAMEGPTPVSALIHAATMVTAGVYLLVRCSSLLVVSYYSLFLILIFGALTTLLCSFMGIDTFDLKRIIASSTASQLGYMFYVCGLTEFSSAISHLFYHAFFKALLFLSAGVIIHALLDEQDIRKMGGLIFKLPLVFVAMFLGSLALIGTPFIGGFYSKDPIIEYSDLLLFIENLITLFCCTLGVFNTTYYSCRLLFFVFLNDYKGSKVVFSKIHATSFLMLFPLLWLMFFTFFSFLFLDILMGEANLIWFFEEENIFFFKEGEEDLDTFFVTFFFLFLGFFFFKNENFFNFFVLNKSYFNFKIFKNINFFKWFFDLFFVKFFVNLYFRFSNFLFILIDRGFIEFFGPLSLVRLCFMFVNWFINLQTGFLYHYIFFQIINLFFFIFFFNDFILETKFSLFFFLFFFGCYRFFFFKEDFFLKKIKVIELKRKKSNFFFKRYYSSFFKGKGNIIFIFFLIIWFFVKHIISILFFVFLFVLRIFISLPFGFGYFIFFYFIWKPFFFFIILFFKLFLRLFSSILFYIFLFFFFLYKKFFFFKNLSYNYSNFNNIPNDAKEFIFFNRTNNKLFKTNFGINKKFPQLHEIESSFFNLHYPSNSRETRIYNFFHPLDFKTWFWRTGDYTNIHEDDFQSVSWFFRQLLSNAIVPDGMNSSSSYDVENRTVPILDHKHPLRSFLNTDYNVSWWKVLLYSSEERISDYDIEVSPELDTLVAEYIDGFYVEEDKNLSDNLFDYSTLRRLVPHVGEINYGNVNNPLLWFSNLYDSYLPAEDSWLSGAVYKERFLFFKEYIVKNIIALPQNFADNNISVPGYKAKEVFSNSGKRGVPGLSKDYSVNIVQQDSVYLSYSGAINNFPFNYYNTKWFLLPDTFSSTLKWVHRDGYLTSFPSFLTRFTASDFWVSRRRFARYWFSESQIVFLIRNNVFYKFFNSIENNFYYFLFEFLPSDFFFIDLKYFLLKILLINYLPFDFLLFSDFDLITQIIYIYKLLFIKLLLSLSDRWLWYLIGISKVFLATVINFFFDDIIGFFLIYTANLESVHHYIPLDPLVRNGHICRFVPLDLSPNQERIFAHYRFRYNLEKWSYHLQNNQDFLSLFYLERRNGNTKNNFYKNDHFVFSGDRRRPFFSSKFSKVHFLRRSQLSDENLSFFVYGDRLFKEQAVPFEFDYMYNPWFKSFQHIVSYQKYVSHKYRKILPKLLYSSRKSYSRISNYKYIKPLSLSFLNLDNFYSFSFQNDLIKQQYYGFFTEGHPYISNILSTYNGQAKGFNKSFFANVNKPDLLINHFFYSTRNNPGMSKIIYEKFFNFFLDDKFVNYSIFKSQYRVKDYIRNPLLLNYKTWLFNDDENLTRKSFFFFFQWSWTKGFLEEFFFFPIFDYLFFSKSYEFLWRSPLNFYDTSNFFQTYLKQSYHYDSLVFSRNLDYFSNLILNYDKSYIFDVFSYNPNFSGQNPYNIFITGNQRSLKPLSFIFDFADQPKFRQQVRTKDGLFSYRFKNIFPHRRRSSDKARNDDIFVKLFLGWPMNNEESRQNIGSKKPFFKPSYWVGISETKELYLNQIKVSMRSVYLYIPSFFKFFFTIYFIFFSLLVAYFNFFLLCYKQIIFIIFLFFVFKLYFFTFRLIIFEYKMRLLLFKLKLIKDKKLFVKNSFDLINDKKSFFFFNFLNNNSHSKIINKLSDYLNFISIYFPELLLIPSYYVSDIFLSYRKFLFFNFLSNLPFFLFVKPFLTLFYLFNIFKTKSFIFIYLLSLVKISDGFFSFFCNLFFLFFSFFKNLIFRFFVRFKLFLFKRFKVFLFRFLIFLKFFLNNNFFSFSFFFYCFKYLFLIFFFIFFKLFLFFFKILRFFIILSLCFFFFNFYLDFYGLFISEFSSSLVSFFIFFFIIWFLSFVSSSWTEHILESGFPIFQPFQEDSIFVDDVFDSDVLFDLTFDNESPRFVEFPYSLGEGEHDYYEFIEFEGGSLDFSDGEYLDLEVSELSKWQNSGKSFSLALADFVINKNKMKKQLLSQKFNSFKMGLSDVEISELNSSLFNDFSDTKGKYKGFKSKFLGRISGFRYKKVNDKQLKNFIFNKVFFNLFLRNVKNGSFFWYLNSLSKIFFVRQTFLLKKNLNNLELLLWGYDFSNFVPKKTFLFSVETQRFLLYVDAVHSLDLLTQKVPFYVHDLRQRQEFLEVYKTYIFPYHRYFNRLYGFSFSGSLDISDLDSFSFVLYGEDDRILNYDHYNMFSEYFRDEPLDDAFLTNDYDTDMSELDEDASAGDLVDSFFISEEDLEEDYDFEEEDDLDYLIPADYPGISDYFLSYDFGDGVPFNFSSNVFFSDVVPVELSNFYKEEHGDDFLLINKHNWVFELLIDRFFVDTTMTNDLFFKSDFLQLSRVALYSDNFYIDDHSFFISSNFFRYKLWMFIKNLNFTKIGLATGKLKRLTGILNPSSNRSFGLDEYGHSKSNIRVMSKGLDNAPHMSVDYNIDIFNLISKNRTFIYMYHPYFLNPETESIFCFNIVPLLGYESFDNKYKRKFFRNPIFYINLLNLKNYPDLTITEAQRLWLFLGCTEKEWFSVDNSKVNLVKPYDPLDLPFFISMACFWWSLKKFYRYGFFEPLYYKHVRTSFIDRFFMWAREHPKTGTRRIPHEYFYEAFSYVNFYKFFVNCFSFLKEFFSFLNFLFNYYKIYFVNLSFDTVFLKEFFFYFKYPIFFNILFFFETLLSYLKVSYFVKYSFFLPFFKFFFLLHLKFFFYFFSYFIHLFLNFFYFFDFSYFFVFDDLFFFKDSFVFVDFFIFIFYFKFFVFFKFFYFYIISDFIFFYNEVPFFYFFMKFFFVFFDYFFYCFSFFKFFLVNFFIYIYNFFIILIYFFLNFLFYFGFFFYYYYILLYFIIIFIIIFLIIFFYKKK